MSSQSNSSQAATGALIFLHGLGDTPDGWSSLKTQLARLEPRLANIRYVFPKAPMIPISINGGAVMPGWFDLYNWPISVGIREDREGKLKAVRVGIEREVRKLQQEGIDLSRIVVGGFSQGGAVALLAAYHENQDKTSFAGCVALSAWLTLTEDLNVSEGKKTPLLWLHGKYDDKVLFPQQAFGIDKLKEQGVVDIRAMDYPIGHESDPSEIRALAAFLDSVLFDDGS